MEDDAHERARERADEAKRTAQDRATTEAERLTAEARTGPITQEVLGQQGLIYGGLIIIGVYMVQPFLTAPSLDASAKVSIVAFAVAIPLLAALVMVNRQEAFRRRLTPSVTVTLGRVVAQLAAFVGSVAGFWHITWIAGVAFWLPGSWRWAFTRLGFGASKRRTSTYLRIWRSDAGELFVTDNPGETR